MAENQDKDMSVDELLAKLKRDVLGEDVKTGDENTQTAAPVGETAAEETPVEETPAVEAVADEAPIEEAPEETAEETPAEETPAEETPAEEASAEEASVFSPTLEEDIIAAWGLDKNDPPQQEEAAPAPEEEIPEPESGYTAPHAASTLIYRVRSVERPAEYRARKLAEQEAAANPAEPKPRTDPSLLGLALGYEKDETWESEGSSADFTDYVPPRTRLPHSIDSPKEEFISTRQRDDILQDYRRWHRSSLIKLIAICAVALFTFVVECLPLFGVALPDPMSEQLYPVVHAMLSLQMLLFAGALCYREIANAALALLKGKFTDGFLLLAIMGLTLIFDIIACFLPGMPVFNFAAVLCAAAVRLFDFLDICRQQLAFDVVSAERKRKYIATQVSCEELRRVTSGLEDYTGEDAQVLGVEKCRFVKNYFARTDARSEDTWKYNRILLPVLLFAGLVGMILSLALRQSAAESIGVFSATVAVGLPPMIFLSAALPLYRAARKLYAAESTLVGETAPKIYAGTTMLCFDDEDAFPAYGVSIENLRIYGSGNIETIIGQMNAVFQKVGGPLRHVFALMLTECPRPFSARVDEVFENGIVATVDGKKLLIGTAAFMREQNLAVSDVSDTIGGKQFSTMYLAEDGALRAKFYIRYALDGEFETMVKKLARHGIASVILTGDANISDELLSRFINIARLPVKVVRRSGVTLAVQGDRAESGLVSAGTVGSLVSAVTMCDKLFKVLGTLSIARVASVVVSALVMLAFALLGMGGVVHSLYAALYQLLWLFPVLLITKFNI